MALRSSARDAACRLQRTTSRRRPQEIADTRSQSGPRNSLGNHGSGRYRGCQPAAHLLGARAVPGGLDVSNRNGSRGVSFKCILHAGGIPCRWAANAARRALLAACHRVNTETALILRNWPSPLLAGLTQGPLRRRLPSTAPRGESTGSRIARDTQPSITTEESFTCTLIGLNLCRRLFALPQ